MSAMVAGRPAPPHPRSRLWWIVRSRRHLPWRCGHRRHPRAEVRGATLTEGGCSSVRCCSPLCDAVRRQRSRPARVVDATGPAESKPWRRSRARLRRRTASPVDAVTAEEAAASHALTSAPTQAASSWQRGKESSPQLRCSAHRTSTPTRRKKSPANSAAARPRRRVVGAVYCASQSAPAPWRSVVRASWWLNEGVAR